MEVSVKVTEDRCKGCGLCVAACPKQVLAMGTGLNKKGYHPATVARRDDCIRCAACAMICPDSVITLEA
ncbi:Photosystem I iron-sulfur center [bioreactor metagenome]|uniref:Photosystem I iron-sulfur center n=1 Tax=bioreactor metagenome TaxID=1076179 RepID=A0A645BIC9_9ZZZZ